MIVVSSLLSRSCPRTIARQMATVPSAASQRSKTVKKIAIEGNIAAGKSTFLSILEKEFNFSVVPEPLSRWQRIGEEEKSGGEHVGNLLDIFYKDPKRWAYTFQTFACLTRVRAQLEACPEELLKARDPILFYERSVYSDKFCFMENCYRAGLANHVEWNLYCDWHTHLLGALGGLAIDGFVYLRVSPEVCMERLKKRSRSEENTVGLDYLQSLHDRHEEWLIKKEKALPKVIKDVPIFILECDDDFESNPVRQQAMVKELREFLARCGSSSAD